METKSAAKEYKEQNLVITRIFNAPVEMVWRAWTEPEQCMRWWGPKGFTTPVCKIELRVGGRLFYCMRSPEGKDYWGKGVYQEIVPYRKIVYTDSFSDENGNVVPASHYGIGNGFPLELLVAVEFEDLGGRTKMTLTHKGMPAGEMKEMTGAGWKESFDKLEESFRRR